MTTPPWCREKVMVYYIIIIYYFTAALNIILFSELFFFVCQRLQLQTLGAYCDVSGLFTTMFPDDGSLQLQKNVKTEAELKK